ncbi:uncharacterized protein BJ171DRAFT_501944 [Polychytrium aggregatum]|uniref:uncharacterized protein n=1 Tax=Polychytrium aggregatum TaxID=110093 RepID=UPI0022FDC2A3|nr:uncharacterized protein BJ171DRAFT_501944 [Polychytrium aggregatum]KAI9205384.1 hypothetical protein BJ171DRAFT_501944 [Polychytrium aggregatum]
MYVSLATIKPFGRPANRTIFFRGFLTDPSCSETHQPNPVDETNTDKPVPLSAKQPSSLTLFGDEDLTDEPQNFQDERVSKELDPLHRDSQTINYSSLSDEERLGNMIVFVLDARSGSVNDLLHGSNFGEVCWFMPETKHQYRLSGRLHLIVSPHHSLVTNHMISDLSTSALDFPNMDWEKKRLEVWHQISPLRRASFAWPSPGKEKSNDQEEYLKELHPLEINPALCEHHDAKTKQWHEQALQNFCLLLLDVDGMDFLNLGAVPHVRTKFRRTLSPSEAVGKVRADVHACAEAMTQWTVQEVNP